MNLSIGNFEEKVIEKNKSINYGSCEIKKNDSYVGIDLKINLWPTSLRGVQKDIFYSCKIVDQRGKTHSHVLITSYGSTLITNKDLHFGKLRKGDNLTLVFEDLIGSGSANVSAKMEIDTLKSIVFPNVSIIPPSLFDKGGFEEEGFNKDKNGGSDLKDTIGNIPDILPDDL